MEPNSHKKRKVPPWFLGAAVVTVIGVIGTGVFQAMTGASEADDGGTSSWEDTGISTMHREVLLEVWSSLSPRLKSEFCQTFEFDPETAAAIYVGSLKADFGIRVTTEEEQAVWLRASEAFVTEKCA